MGIMWLLVILLGLCIAIATLAVLIWAVSPYGRGSDRPVQALRAGERGGLYFAAFYPAVSLVLLMLISSAMKLHYSSEPSVSYFLFFGGQTLLSAYSVSVCAYLRRYNRAFTTLLIASLISGACYLFMITFALWMPAQ